MTMRRHYWKPPLPEACEVTPSAPVHAFSVPLPAGTWRDAHAHEHWGELVYVAAGRIVVCTPEGNYLGQPNRGVWIPPGLPHEWYLPEPANNRTLFIHTDALPNPGRFRHYQALDLPPLVRELIIAQSEPDTAGDQRLTDALMDRLDGCKSSHWQLLMPQNHRLIELCAAYLLDPENTVRLRDWSELLGMSERTLARLFQRETGMTFGQWLKHARLQQAAVRMTPDSDITSVALECGYSSVSAFIATFKKQFGCTPKAFCSRQKPAQ